MSGKALERITDSLPELPMAVRVFLERLKQRVERKFPGARLKAIGAFMFLRFMQPSIFSPGLLKVVVACVCGVCQRSFAYFRCAN